MKLTLFIACVALLVGCSQASADTRVDSHAPIGVMGDHFHHKGEVMFSYRFMRMFMQGNRRGSSSVSPEAVVRTEPNRFAAPPMQPPNLRVVPTEMSMDMHMFGLMYAPSDYVTLMGMVQILDKDMTHITFAGPMGTNRLGQFETHTRGLGDTSLSALVNVYEGDRSRWHVTAGVSLPTGDIDETGRILTPMNTRPTVRLPYPMQLGSGTYDLITGVTYAGNADRWSWGGQWRSVFRIGENDEHYSLGDEHRVTGWGGYRLTAAVSVSGRVEYFDRGNIDGIDPLIVAPVQTADPDRQAIERWELGLGVNFLLPGDRQRIALEVVAPIEQKLAGPQLETDWHMTLGWQFAL